MKSDIKNVAAFLAVAIWADGIYASEEKKILADIAEALDVDVAELTENVEISLNELEGKDEEAVQAYLIDNACWQTMSSHRMRYKCCLASRTRRVRWNTPMLR